MAQAAIDTDDGWVEGGCEEGGRAEEGQGGGLTGGREVTGMWEMVMGRCPLGEWVADGGGAGGRPPGAAERVDTEVVENGEETHPHAHQHGGGAAMRAAPLAMVRLLR